MKRFILQFLALGFCSFLRGLFDLVPFHPLFGLIVLMQIASKSTLLEKRFLVLALSIGAFYEFIDPVLPMGTMTIASLGGFLALREASHRFDPPQKLTLPIFTSIYSFVFELSVIFTCLHYVPTAEVLFKRLILLPLIDGAFAFLWFLLPKYVITFLNRRERKEQIDA